MERDAAILPTQHHDEDGLTRAIMQLASQYGRYGYRRITVELGKAGWCVGKDRVQRIWRREGLQVPQKQRPRGRLWLNDGSLCAAAAGAGESRVELRLRQRRTHDGRTLRLLTLIDEYTRKCLAIRVARRLNSYDLIETLADVMLMHGVPEHIRSDNGPSSLPRSCGSGCRRWGRRRCTSSPAVRGRTDTVKASTASCETNA